MRGHLGGAHTRWRGRPGWAGVGPAASRPPPSPGERGSSCCRLQGRHSPTQSLAPTVGAGPPRALGRVATAGGPGAPSVPGGGRADTAGVFPWWPHWCPPRTPGPRRVPTGSPHRLPLSGPTCSSRQPRTPAVRPVRPWRGLWGPGAAGLGFRRPPDLHSPVPTPHTLPCPLSPSEQLRRHFWVRSQQRRLPAFPSAAASPAVVYSFLFTLACWSPSHCNRICTCFLCKTLSAVGVLTSIIHPTNMSEH